MQDLSFHNKNNTMAKKNPKYNFKLVTTEVVLLVVWSSAKALNITQNKQITNKIVFFINIRKI